MDRGERRARKARIRRRLLREFVHSYRTWVTGPDAVIDERVASLLRRILRDDGGARWKLFRYFGRYHCEPDPADTTYASRRESARMDAERAAWRTGKEE